MEYPGWQDTFSRSNQTLGNQACKDPEAQKSFQAEPENLNVKFKWDIKTYFFSHTVGMSLYAW